MAERGGGGPYGDPPGTLGDPPCRVSLSLSWRPWGSKPIPQDQGRDATATRDNEYHHCAVYWHQARNDECRVVYLCNDWFRIQLTVLITSEWSSTSSSFRSSKSVQEDPGKS